ncbi:MAG: hypothetical protein ACOVP4_09785 [Bacteriovoracaceae bacterium]
MSNFNQTDKQVQEWFLLLPDGHEGPYSLEQLELKIKEGLSPDCKVWKQGSEEARFLKDILLSSNDEGLPEIPELPPVPADEELPPDLPLEAQFVPEIQVELATTKTSQNTIRIIVGVTLILGIFLGIKFLFSTPGEVGWSRPQKMPVETYRTLSSKLILNDWDQDLFFYEATAPDYSKFWLVTPQAYKCDIEAQFTAEESDILTLEEIKKISFKSKTKLVDHVAEFEQFEFEGWPKLVPGFYKMDLVAKNCEWSGLKSRLANFLKKPPTDITLSYRIGITAQKVEFLSIALKKLAEEKFRLEQRKKLAADQFWQDVQQKYQTLMAISLQIEQLFIDFLSQKIPWKNSLKVTVDKYTRMYGALLTNFVVSNEEDFKKLRQSQTQHLSVKTGYESKIRAVAKGMGLKSMTFIESWQKLTPKAAEAARPQIKKEVTKTFSQIKKDIEQKIIDVTEEQANLTE